MLRLFLRSRPGARGALTTTIGFGSARYISMSVGTPGNMDKAEGAKAAGTSSSSTTSTTPEPGRIAKWFPLSASEGWSQWWAGLTPMATEHRVLSFVPHILAEEHAAQNETPDPHGPRRWHSTMVQLAGKGRALNEFSVERVGEPIDNVLVMLHGYGAGLGFFYRNFEGLSRAPGWKLYALDLLGMGRSSRSPFKIHATDKAAKIAEAEAFFIDALEEWRIKRGIQTFTLLGHSLGGYLAVAYALKYPGHLNKLILASPVGIPEDPHAVNDALPDPADSTLANEFTQDAAAAADNNNFLNQANKPATGTATPRRRIPPWLSYLWEANVLSPFSFVRWSGPLGPRLVSGWTSRRFSHLPEQEAQALHDYSYALFRQRGSSEYALGYLLAPGAFARSPLIRRIHGVGRQSLTTPSDPPTPTIKETPYPVLLLYGSHDWMDKNGGLAAAAKIHAERDRLLSTASPEERERDKGTAKVVVIDNAGHHVYLDGWEQFNEVLRGEMAK